MDYSPRLPNVRRGIEQLIPKVKERNRDELIISGGESCLLYLPSSTKSDAIFDDVRQTYLNQDKTYKLYLNRHREPDGTRLYTDDTEIIPSILVAFPANPDAESKRDEGFVLTNQTKAWTLWDPIIPKVGTILKRITPEGAEWWLVENVTPSYWANYEKTKDHILHQEFSLGLLTDYDGGIDVQSFPTVYDTLAVYSNHLTESTPGLTLKGSPEILNGSLQMGNLHSIKTMSSYFKNNGVAFNFQKVTQKGKLSIRWTTFQDDVVPEFEINLSRQTASFNLIIGEERVRIISDSPLVPFTFGFVPCPSPVTRPIQKESPLIPFSFGFVPSLSSSLPNRVGRVESPLIPFTFGCIPRKSPIQRGTESPLIPFTFGFVPYKSIVHTNQPESPLIPFTFGFVPYRLPATSEEKRECLTQTNFLTTTRLESPLIPFTFGFVPKTQIVHTNKPESPLIPFTFGFFPHLANTIIAPNAGPQSPLIPFSFGFVPKGTTQETVVETLIKKPLMLETKNQQNSLILFTFGVIPDITKGLGRNIQHVKAQFNNSTIELRFNGSLVFKYDLRNLAVYSRYAPINPSSVTITTSLDGSSDPFKLNDLYVMDLL